MLYPSIGLYMQMHVDDMLRWEFLVQQDNIYILILLYANILTTKSVENTCAILIPFYHFTLVVHLSHLAVFYLIIYSKLLTRLKTHCHLKKQKNMPLTKYFLMVHNILCNLTCAVSFMQNWSFPLTRVMLIFFILYPTQMKQIFFLISNSWDWLLLLSNPETCYLPMWDLISKMIFWP